MRGRRRAAAEEEEEGGGSGFECGGGRRRESECGEDFVRCRHPTLGCNATTINRKPPKRRRMGKNWKKTHTARS